MLYFLLCMLTFFLSYGFGHIIGLKSEGDKSPKTTLVASDTSTLLLVRR